MGNEKTTQTTDRRVQATPEEIELNKLQLDLARSSQEGQKEVQGSGLSLINQLLTGQALPGFLEGLPGGISEDLTTDIAQKAVSDIAPGFQAAGILDSGVAADISARTAGDIRRSSAEFNIGNLLNLLNLAVGGQAQIQSPLLAQSGQLGQRLAGLRSETGTGTTLGMNPFLKSFQQSAGQTLGSPNFSGGPFTFGG